MISPEDMEKYNKCMAEGEDCDCKAACKHGVTPEIASSAMLRGLGVFQDQPRLREIREGVNTSDTEPRKLDDARMQEIFSHAFQTQRPSQEHLNEVILRAVDKCHPSTDGERFCLYNIIETAIEEATTPASKETKINPPDKTEFTLMLANELCREIYGPYMATVNQEHKDVAIRGVVGVLERFLK